jgi:hypothetical protein
MPDTCDSETHAPLEKYLCVDRSSSRVAQLLGLQDNNLEDIIVLQHLHLPLLRLTLLQNRAAIKTCLFHVQKSENCSLNLLCFCTWKRDSGQSLMILQSVNFACCLWRSREQAITSVLQLQVESEQVKLHSQLHSINTICYPPPQSLTFKSLSVDIVTFSHGSESIRPINTEIAGQLSWLRVAVTEQEHNRYGWPYSRVPCAASNDTPS